MCEREKGRQKKEEKERDLSDKDVDDEKKEMDDEVEKVTKSGKKRERKRTRKIEIPSTYRQKREKDN